MKYAIMILLMPLFAFAQVEMPEQIEGATLAQLINQLVYVVTNWKLAGTVGAIAMVIIVIVNMLQSPSLDKVFEKLGSIGKRALITVLGVGLSILLYKLSGVTWVDSAVTALFTTGGAVAIYEAIKPLIKK